ncbi:MAG: methyltransferase domain-containing protein [Hyphomicrobiales bacterium]|nr:methyltransferase domain-containing protein [Hyphomicrobiales bacterium]
MTATSLSRRYFEDLYAADADPWRFATSVYESAKYRRSIEALPHARYRKGLEVGCSIGVMTRKLAERCDDLVAIDIAAAPLAVARMRCAEMTWVRFARMTVPKEWPNRIFDLIVLSEVVYYLDEADVALLAHRAKSTLASSGNILLVHWTRPTNYPLTGDRAAELFIDQASTYADVRIQKRTKEFRLDLLTRSRK